MDAGQRPMGQCSFNSWDDGSVFQCRQKMVIIVFEEENSWCLSCSLKSFLEHCRWEIKNSPFFCVWGVGKGDVLGGG